MRKKLLSVLFWSVISAAFIGPGTVTTAAAAGAGFGMQLLWALVFSTFGCIILQEAAARVTISTGHNLGEAISLTYSKNKIIKWIILVAIVTGGAAYQAGNILGAISGIALEFDIDFRAATLLIAVLGSTLLWFGRINLVANLMGFVVAIMGFAFIFMAINSSPDLSSILSGLSFRVPEDSEIYIIGLIGTTIVPYNLFLASGISKGQSISEMRWGLIPAVFLGGMISIAIMMVGAQVVGGFSFSNLGETLAAQSGEWAKLLLAIGLFAAGFTSSITAPLATSVTGKSLMGPTWDEKSVPYRVCWGIVILSGLIFGISGVRPVPVIILAQAFNGFLLPGVTVFLIIILNHPKVMSRQNSKLSNTLLLIVLFITLFLGLNNLGKLLITKPDPNYYSVILLTSALILFSVIWRIRKLNT